MILTRMVYLSLLAAAAGAAAAQEPAPAQEQQRPTSLEVAQRLQGEQLTLPPPYDERIRQQGSFRDLSVRDAIQLALTNNLDLEIQNYNEALTRETILNAQGFYDPVLRFTVGWEDSTSPTTSDLDAGMSDRFTWTTNYSQQLPTGGNYTLALNNSRRSDNNAFTRLNPAFSSSFSVDVRQPLWRGFRETNTERRIKVANLSKEIDDLQFEQRVAEVIQSVQNQYWELVFAIDNYETQRQSMELAIIQHTNNQKRVRIGVSAPIAITTSRAEVASREQSMISSEVNIITAQNRLRRLLSSDPDATIWNLTLLPTDAPATPQITMGIREAIDIGLRNRPELQQIQKQLEQNEVERKFFKRELRPNIDLRFNYTSAAVSGDQITLDDDDNRIVTPLGNLGNSLFDVFKFDANSWAIFADISIPLGNRSNKANLAQVAINERRNLSRLRDAQQGIVVEVRNAYEGLKTQEKRLEAARLSRELSEEQLRGENKRFQAGLSTNVEVLRFQRDLTSALSQELRALIDYEQAVTSLRKATYTIISESDIVLARDESKN